MIKKLYCKNKQTFIFLAPIFKAILKCDDNFAKL